MIGPTLDRARQLAASLMQDTCLIRRVTGTITDTFSGVITSTYTTVYSGPCKVQEHQAQGHSADPGEDYTVVLMRELHLPVATSLGLQRNDLVSITASAGDPDLVGRTFLIRDEASKSLATARRLSIQEAT